MLMTQPEDIRRFVTAGKATITLSSKATGARFTYKIKKVPDAEDKFFVSLLTGPENEGDYRYLGLMQGAKLRRTAKSCASDSAPSFLAAQYFCDKVLGDHVMPPSLEVRHEGRCGKCNRKLTTPESIDRGIGPECWSRM